MKKQVSIVIVALHLAGFSASGTVVINFDTDAFGNPLAAPALAIETVHLSELYAPLGVHFYGPDGPNGHDGGAIVNQAANFGINPRSGKNFLGFNRQAFLMDFGVERDPETITFDTLASNVSIFAGGTIAETFLMQGFDINGTLIATDTVTTQRWSELEISSATGIKSVTLFVTGPDVGIPLAFVYDDLSVDFVPEPATSSFLLCAAASVLAFHLRRKKT
jgi:hypothetical protein